jgi:23S rRNA pseudouridine2457 synthase
MPRLVLLNKPYRVLCQFTRPQGMPASGQEHDDRATLAETLDVPNVYAAGRLDWDTEGLVVLTDAGFLQHLITDPRFKLTKLYWAQVEGNAARSALDQLASGVMLKDGLTRPAVVTSMAEPDLWPRVPPIRFRKNVPTSWLSLTISEGRNRQVRRMCAAVGLPVLRLVRQAVGPWSLGTLQPGQWQEVPCPRDRLEWTRLLGGGAGPAT